MDEKSIEKARYDDRADSLLRAAAAGASSGASSVPSYLRDPYLAYEEAVRRAVVPGVSVLEIGSGSGEFTGAALRAGVEVLATDISEKCLSVIPVRYPDAEGRLSVRQADMEALPFADGSFDVVMSAGSLSYGDNNIVMMEIHRVLRPRGRFICVDSLDHNPIYRMNRSIHRIRGQRTASTLRRMPRIGLLEEYSRVFGSVEVRYFGAVSWMMPTVASLFGADTASGISRWIDRWVGVKRSAFNSS